MLKENNSSSDFEYFSFEVFDEKRLDLFLYENLKEYRSRSKFQKIIKDGYVKVNRKVITKPSSMLQINSIVEINLPVEKELKLVPKDMGIPILFQDKYFAVIHKPADITVHPGSGTKDDTLVHGLIAQIKKLSEGSETLRPGIVHRLDRETEGLMIIAKTDKAHEEFSKLFQERKIIKEYTAFLWGKLAKQFDVIDGFIGRNFSDRKKMRFSAEAIGHLDKEAKLSYKIIRENMFFSKVSINLLTGRTHQIRATFSSMGNPVVGDIAYGKISRLYKNYNIGRKKEMFIEKLGMLLLAKRIKFTHPFTKKEMEFELNDPDRFLKFEEMFF
ncbi:MAG: RluA family pseudouridine synthase [Spirochaetia bacterium]|nr:RluA family pseudouridine synthase [Spirochaetia bacterium]